ncbi:MAG: T9SS C-terminal target domain-containing protein [Chitinophagia bacterium]|nr:T9SS C-terminal target domain-containing protein [Chitinophagia bacterium]
MCGIFRLPPQKHVVHSLYTANNWLSTFEDIVLHAIFFLLETNYYVICSTNGFCMKKIFTLSFLICSLAMPMLAGAQSFSIADTVRFTLAGGGSEDINNNLTINTSSLVLKWNVSSTNFPSDWIAAMGICDNVLCYPSSSLWPTNPTNTTYAYTMGVGGFHMVFNSGTITHAGTYYLKVKFLDPATLASDSTVFLVTAIGAAKVTTVAYDDDNVSLYPNPARNEVNLVFNNYTDVRTISLYNNIGTVVAVFKIQSTSANLNLENIPSGIYFARLQDAHGSVIATKRFTKQ